VFYVWDERQLAVKDNAQLASSKAMLQKTWKKQAFGRHRVALSCQKLTTITDKEDNDRDSAWFHTVLQ